MKDLNTDDMFLPTLKGHFAEQFANPIVKISAITAVIVVLAIIGVIVG